MEDRETLARMATVSVDQDSEGECSQSLLDRRLAKGRRSLENPFNEETLAKNTEEMQVPDESAVESDQSGRSHFLEDYLRCISAVENILLMDKLRQVNFPRLFILFLRIKHTNSKYKAFALQKTIDFASVGHIQYLLITSFRFLN